MQQQHHQRQNVKRKMVLWLGDGGGGRKGEERERERERERETAREKEFIDTLLINDFTLDRPLTSKQRADGAFAISTNSYINGHTRGHRAFYT